MTMEMEYEGSNVANAIKKASEDLNIPAEELKHNVISHGSTGIFGLVGTKKARIRVKVPETINENKGDPQEDLQREDLKTDPAETVRSLVEATFETDNHVTIEIEELADTSREVLQKLVDFITVEALATVKGKSGEQILLGVEGGNSAVLIGKRGQTLEAMQYLVEKVVNRRVSKRIRIEIDIEGYMQNRRDGLLRLAARLAEKANRSGRPMNVGQMNAHDRRIVHMALKDDKRVRTQSIGDGLSRKLVVFPKKSHTRNRKTR